MTLLFVLPLGISAVTVGFGFLITINIYTYDTIWQWFLVPIAHNGRHSISGKTITPIVKGIDKNNLEMAYLLGAGSTRTFLVLRQLLFYTRNFRCFLLCPCSILGEFGATVFLFISEGATFTGNDLLLHRQTQCCLSRNGISVLCYI